MKLTLGGNNFMKRSISLALLTTLFVSACSEPEPPPRRQRASTYQTAPETQYTPVPQPFEQGATPSPAPEVAATQSPPERSASRWTFARNLGFFSTLTAESTGETNFS
jgi:hypothetical protein